MMNAIESSIVARAITLGYANARVKAMKQLLLTHKETDAMAEATGVEEVYALLERTQYRQDLVSSALAGKTLADQIEFACAKNFSRTLRKIIKIVPKKLSQKISEMFEKYEINNIKTIILAKHMGEGKERISHLLIETGMLSKAATAKMLESKSVKDVSAALAGTIYGTILEKNMKKYEKEKEAAPLLAALDDYYYRKLPHIAKNPYGDERIILAMLKAQVDAKNISNILRGKKEGMKEEKITEIIIAGGNISRDRLVQAAGAKGVEEAAKAFEKNFKLAKALEAYKKNGSLIPIEIEVEKSVARKGLSLLSVSVLSIGAIAGFLFLKEEEASNIRKIVRAKEFNLSAEKIGEMIVQY
ncbi:MAG TPA: V-type ATPase subunit [archaeon]|nr:V-type ATPase subunit [archaeon]